MILIALALACIFSVPLTGGRLSRLASARIRATWLPVAALAVQVAIVTVAPGGSPALHRALHLASYALIVAFLLANRRLPAVPVILAGAASNALVIAANGGVMPASASAERLAGLRLGAGFHNSALLAHPHLLALGDVIPWPGPLPNVLSVGDCLIYAGTLVLVHRLCRRPREARPSKAAGPVSAIPGARKPIPPQGPNRQCSPARRCRWQGATLSRQIRQARDRLVDLPRRAVLKRRSFATASELSPEHRSGTPGGRPGRDLGVLGDPSRCAQPRPGGPGRAGS